MRKRTKGFYLILFGQFLFWISLPALADRICLQSLALVCKYGNCVLSDPARAPNAKTAADFSNSLVAYLQDSARGQSHPRAYAMRAIDILFAKFRTLRVDSSEWTHMRRAVELLEAPQRAALQRRLLGLVDSLPIEQPLAHTSASAHVTGTLIKIIAALEHHEDVPFLVMRLEPSRDIAIVRHVDGRTLVYSSPDILTVNQIFLGPEQSLFAIYERTDGGKGFAQFYPQSSGRPPHVLVESAGMIGYLVEDGRALIDYTSKNGDNGTFILNLENLLMYHFGLPVENTRVSVHGKDAFSRELNNQNTVFVVEHEGAILFLRDHVLRGQVGDRIEEELVLVPTPFPKMTALNTRIFRGSASTVAFAYSPEGNKNYTRVAMLDTNTAATYVLPYLPTELGMGDLAEQPKFIRDVKIISDFEAILTIGVPTKLQDEEGEEYTADLLSLVHWNFRRGEVSPLADTENTNIVRRHDGIWIAADSDGALFFYDPSAGPALSRSIETDIEGLKPLRSANAESGDFFYNDEGLYRFDAERAKMVELIDRPVETVQISWLSQRTALLAVREDFAENEASLSLYIDGSEELLQLASVAVEPNSYLTLDKLRDIDADKSLVQLVENYEASGKDGTPNRMRSHLFVVDRATKTAHAVGTLSFETNHRSMSVPRIIAGTDILYTVNRQRVYFFHPAGEIYAAFTPIKAVENKNVYSVIQVESERGPTVGILLDDGISFYTLEKN